MRILQVNTYDLGGGAEGVVSRLHSAYCATGHDALFAVKRRRGDAPGVVSIPQSAGCGPWGRFFLSAATKAELISDRTFGAHALASALRAVGRPLGTWDRQRGVEDFRFPASRRLPRLTPEPPDILQCHNLHGGYFDLDALRFLSRSLPVVLTLHDCWLTSGHCAHSFDCSRWRTGCGECPDLGIYPSIAKDATAANWRRKQAIFRDSRVYVAAPSGWLMDRVGESIVAPAIIDSRVIHNGIDDRFFEAESRADARRRLGIDEETVVLLFVANTIRQNEWKDFATLRAAVARIIRRLDGREVQVLGLGDDGADEPIGDARLKFIPFVKDVRTIATYYRAADLYLHSARVETFSLTIAEAMACGIPVIATAVGAVPERIRSLNHVAAAPGFDRWDAEYATGILVPPEGDEAMAEAALTLLNNRELHRKTGTNAAKTARESYRMETQAEAFLTWFREILDGRKKASVS